MTTTHAPLPVGEESLQLAVPVILPGVDDADDGCVSRLQERLQAQTGISQAHVERDEGKAVLCLHYDPNLVPLEKLERLTRDEGAAIIKRYKHETISVVGMDCASCAAGIEHVVRKQAGVLKVNVNYPTQKMKVEYDSNLVQRADIIKAVTRLGYRVPNRSRALTMLPTLPSGTGTTPTQDKPHDHAHHDHHACDHAHHDHAPVNGHSHGVRDDHPVHHEYEAMSWLFRHREMALALLSGLLLVVGFVGENVLHFPLALSLAFYIGSYVAGGYNLARHALPMILSGRFDVEFLMLAGAAGAAILGEWPEGAFLLFLFSLGHALEHFAMEKARDAISALGKITPKVARVRREGHEIEIGVEELRLGDVAIVRPGDRIAVDGVVRQGRSAVDQSPITGESLPQEKDAGDGVFAGSINGDGALEVEVTRLAQDTTMARVIEMVEEAQSQKSPSQTFAEKFENIFVPIVLGVAFLAMILPPLFGWLTWHEAILRGISALVAASPCALALATPAAVLAGIGQAARNGVLIKGGVHLENLGRLNAIALDKTGTITRGRPDVTDIVTNSINEAELVRLAAAVETRSSHPLAQAVVRRATEQKIVLPTAGELQNTPGRGVQSEVEGKLVRLGNAKMFDEAHISVPAELKAQAQKLSDTGKPIMLMGVENQVVGLIAFADQLRPEAPPALKALRDCGIESVIMLTGDNERVAQSIAQAAGVTGVRADLLPEDKVKALDELLKEHGQVAMIGDGVNDAPALANATVGIAMGAGGTDVALETADVALMGDDLSKLPFAVALSRQARRIIQQNLWIALGVIALLVPSTLFGFARLGVAVVFHEGSTLVVVLNALRLLRFRDGK